MSDFKKLAHAIWDCKYHIVGTESGTWVPSAFIKKISLTEGTAVK